jgi:hypothetical protein
MEVANTLAYYDTATPMLAISLVQKYQTRKEVNGRGKHSSLLQYGSTNC